MRGPGTTSQSAARLRLRRSLELRGPLTEAAGSQRPGPDAAAFASPLDLAIGRDAVRRYEAALARLRPRDRAAVLARIELRWSYGELAEALAVASPEAARTVVTRALTRLVERMSE